MKINYQVHGAGIPFVFQHGLGANISQVLRLLQDFPGVQLISSDASGHGESPFDPQNLPSFSSYAHGVLSVLDQLEIPQAIFGGISMGSGISLNICLNHPDRVKGLVLVRPAWLDQGIPQNLKILLDIAEVIDKPNGQKQFEQKEEFQSIKANLPRAAMSILGQFTRDQGNYTSQVLNWMVKDKPFTNLSDLSIIDKPCLVIGNDDDPLHPWEMAEVIHQSIKNSQLVKVHSRYKDDQRHKLEVRKVISEFIENI